MFLVIFTVMLCSHTIPEQKKKKKKLHCHQRLVAYFKWNHHSDMIKFSFLRTKSIIRHLFYIYTWISLLYIPQMKAKKQCNKM